jgi:hypothetical protein
MITKFTKGEGKAMQKATVVPARWIEESKEKERQDFVSGSFL